MTTQGPEGLPWRQFAAEFVGTAVLVGGGLSMVIFMNGQGSPVVRLLPDEGTRRLITGFLFGTIGALIAISRVGRESGAHINPVVTMGFWLMRKLETRVALGYVLAQLAGGVAGSLPLPLWGEMGRSVTLGATLVGPGYTQQAALAGEVVTTFIMVTLLTLFIAFRSIRPFTPAIFPPLYSIMVYLEAPLSGTSTNPARSLGPALVSGNWEGWWIYWAGPVLGAFVAMAACSLLAKRITVAKLYYFDSDRDGLFRRMASRES